MANTGSARSNTAKIASGVAQQTEFQLLNARLAEKADNLQLAEESMWQIFAQYQGYVWDGCIEYPNDFSILDEQREYENLFKAKQTATGPEALAVIDQMLIDLVTDDTELEGMYTVVGMMSTSDAEYENTPTTAPTEAVVESDVPTRVTEPVLTNSFQYSTNNQG
jgi:hypothetical protein